MPINWVSQGLPAPNFKAEGYFSGRRQGAVLLTDVASATPSSYVSLDKGVTWAQVQVDPAYGPVSSFGYSNGLYVAIQQAPNVFTSTDLITWSAAAPSAFPVNASSDFPFSFTADASGFYAIATTSSAGASIVVSHSTDGVTWTETVSTFPITDWFSNYASVFLFDNKLWVSGYEKWPCYSTDGGATWVQVPAPSDTTLEAGAVFTSSPGYNSTLFGDDALFAVIQRSSGPVRCYQWYPGQQAWALCATGDGFESFPGLLWANTASLDFPFVAGGKLFTIQSFHDVARNDQTFRLLYPQGGAWVAEEWPIQFNYGDAIVPTQNRILLFEYDYGDGNVSNLCGLVPTDEGSDELCIVTGFRAGGLGVPVGVEIVFAVGSLSTPPAFGIPVSATGALTIQGPSRATSIGQASQFGTPAARLRSDHSSTGVTTTAFGNPRSAAAQFIESWSSINFGGASSKYKQSVAALHSTAFGETVSVAKVFQRASITGGTRFGTHRMRSATAIWVDGFSTAVFGDPPSAICVARPFTMKPTRFGTPLLRYV